MSRPSVSFATGIWLLGWVSCSVYDKALLKGATGGAAGTHEAGGTTGGSGGDGSGGDAAGETGGVGGTAASAGSDSGGKGSGGSAGASGGGAGKGSGGDGSGGVAGKGSGGTAGKGSGGTAGKGSGGAGGKGGTSAGDGGSSGTGLVGMSGDGGESGCPLGDCCPDDDAKVDPGECGCGVAESCLPLKDSLVHRYSFDGTGTTVADTKGTAHGTVMGTGAMLGGDGTLTLAGGYIPADMDPNKQYVALPSGCLGSLTDATFEAWVDWTPADGTNAQSSWQRIFDFGEAAGSGFGTYLFVSPRVTSTTGPSRVSFTSSMGSANQVYSNGPVLAGGPTHVTVVVDDTNDEILLYIDGVFSSSVAFPGALSAINDTSCYLGRSQFVADPYFAGVLDEFRVYSSALTAADVAFSHASGPNPAFL